MVSKKTEVEEGKIAALLSYLLIGIIWYFVDEKMKKNSFVKYHVQQALVLLIFSVAIAILNAILMGIIGVITLITFGLGAILFFIPTLVGLIPLVFWIFGVIHSLQGVEKELPFIGKYGKKFKI
jgi:uncharacterized membrane protein